ncbi:MAG: HEPN domain-containing protein [Sedimentisphaerales bacterium]|nr:HEPN domain-containing protein [Sedimentisphaerales bacterium]
MQKVPDDKIFVVVREWTAKADNDLKNAVHTLKLGKECPTDTVCFHAQQCVEKYLKAFLVALEKPFPKTHDTESLISFMPKDIRLGLSVEEERRLTEYATVLRYPGPYEAIGLSEAKQAVKLAQMVKRKITKLLEKKPLFE